MANKYNGLASLPVPQNMNQKLQIRDLTLGAILNVPPTQVPPGGSVSLKHVKFENGALRKDFGSSAIGTAAAAKIIGLGEHKYILSGESFHRLIRIRRNAAENAVVDIWNGTSWDETDISSEAIRDEYLSVASTQDRFLFADGRHILTWYETASTQAEGNDFPSGNSLADVGESTSVIVTPNSSIDDEYDIYYSVYLEILSGSDYTVVLSIQHLGVEVDTVSYVLASGIQTWLDEVYNLIKELADEDTLTIEVKSITLGTYPAHSIASWTDPGTTYTLEATKSEVSEAHDDQYTIRFLYTNTGATNSSIAVYYDTGSGWVLKESFSLTPAENGTVIEKIYTIDGMGSGSKFAVDVISGGDGIQDATDPPTGNAIAWSAAEAGVDFILDVKGYNKATDLDAFQGVEYTIALDPDSTLEKLSADAPAARFLLPFGDRLLAFRDGGDHQVAAWSSDGDISSWAGGDSGSTVLVDTRSDGIDDIMGAAVLSASVVAIFRKRSIMRGQETGSIALAMGFFHWIENIGTESPFSIQSTPLGVMFLGHNLQVYLLSEGGPVPVGEPIHDELIRRLTSNLDLVDSAYDPINSEYILGIPEDNATKITGLWIFDLSKFSQQRGMTWRYRPLNVERITTVSVIE